MADQKTERTMAGKSSAKGGAAGGGGKGKDDEAAGGGSKKKLIVVAALGAVLLLGGGGAGSYFLFGGQSASASTEATEEEETLTPGTVTALDPITINLSDGNYLKLGIALQGVEASGGGHESSSELDGSKALDLAISTFSGLSMAELSNADTRTKYKDQLQEAIIKAYTTEPAADDKDAHATKDVMGIYLTQFVMQ